MPRARVTAPGTEAPASGAPASKAPAALPDLSSLDRHLGDLVVEGEIARTPLAAVLRVRIGAHGDRSLALKVALAPCDAEELARFRHEVRLLSEAPHPDVVEVYDCGALPGGFPFLAMELLSPRRVEELASPGGGWDWDLFYELAIQAAAGLAHIHRQGVIHHDVKPSNLGLAAQDGPPRLKILDFGLAQVVRRGLDSRIRGTLAYTAPEVILQDAYDQRADLYSLGLTLYELATGELPSAGGAEAALRFHLGAERPRPAAEHPQLPAPLAALLGRLMARDPERRFPSAGKLLLELGKAAGRRIDPAALATGGTLLSSRLVGREEVMERLRGELEAARQGHGRVVMVSGGEGMGKSRVLRELRLFAAVGGARVGVGRAVAERSELLTPVLEALAALGVEVEAPPPGSGEEGERRERYRLYRGILEALRRQAGGGEEDGAGDGPLVLLLDDLHLVGDGHGGELLSFLVAGVAELPVLVVAAQDPARPAAADGDEEPDASGVLTLELPPFSAELSRQLVDACLGSHDLAAPLYDLSHQRSGGSPGRLQRLLRHLVADGVLRFRNGGWKPSLAALERWAAAAASADDLDAQRLSRFAAGERRVLEAAAVIDEPFRLGAAAELLEEEPLALYGSLSELVERGFLERLRESDGAVYSLPRRFVEALRSRLDDDDRRRLHRRRAEALERAGKAAGETRSAALAHHAWEAGERALALPHLVRAATSAAAVYAWREAAGLWKRAAEAARESGDVALAREATAEQAAALAGSGRLARSLDLYEALLAEAAAGDGPPLPPELEARVLLARGRAHKRLGDHAASLDSYRRGLAALADDDASRLADLALDLTRAEAAALFDLGRLDEAQQRIRSGLRRAGELGVERQRAQLLNALGMVFYARGDFRKAGRLIRRGLTAAQGLGGDGEELAVHLRQNLGNVLWKTGDYEAAHRAYRENLDHCEATHHPWGQLTALNNLGILEASRGEWREARGFLLRALERARRLGAREQEAMARLNVGEVEEMLGDWGRAERHLQRGLTLLAAAPEHPTRHALVAQLASLARRRGDGAAAAAGARQALAGGEESGDRDLAAQCHMLLGLVAKDREDYAEAGEHLRLARELAQDAGAQQLLARVLISLADLALRRQEVAEAGEAVAAARREVDELADRFADAKMLVMEARLAALRHDEDGGGALFARACRHLEELGTPYELGRSLYEWGLRTWNPQLAEERLQRALALFEGLGAEAELRRTRGVVEHVREHGRRGGDRDPVLYEVVKVINSTLDLSEVLDRTMDLVLEHLRAERGMIVLFDPLTRELETAVSRNLGRAGSDEAGELSESVVRRVMDKGEPVVAVDAQMDQRFRGAESIVASNILSILCVPMRIRDRPAGAIYVDHTRSRSLFADADVSFLVAFADQAAVAIEKARLYAEQSAARQRLKEENEALKREILSSHHLGSLIGKSAAIEELKQTLERVSQRDSTVLVRGESGTGKGLVARILHNISSRREGPFVQFNCAALPETLVESELFGHEKGAFTGAASMKQGRFEVADGGTIFLDEVGKVSRSVQAKLLRVVEDKQFERVGGTKTLSVNVRIVAATNLNLEEAIAAGDFREDLYYRLNIIPIVLPPLRERREDVPYLVQHFLKVISRDLGQAERELDPAVLELFARYPWQGNVRELESAVHRALVLSAAERLSAADFSWIALKSGDPGAAAAAAVAGAAVPELAEGGYQEALDGYDRRLLEAALDRCEGRIRQTARLLGIARNTLKAKMDRYGIER